MPSWQYIKAFILKNYNIDKNRLTLFVPVILGIGILIGVYFPFQSKTPLFIFIIAVVVLAILAKINIVSCILCVFTLGIYVAQTGGILRTDLLTHKKFIEKPYNRISFQADVNYIEETHPIMKNMQRINLKNIVFIKNPELNFIKTAKMTCSTKLTTNIKPNDIVKIFGRLLPFKSAVVPCSFDQKQYYTLNDIDTTGIVFSVEKISTSQHFNIFNYIRRILTSNIIHKMGNNIGGVASALLTGDKSSISIRIRDVFIKSGTAHILAISGLHMTLISSIIYMFFFRLMLYLSCIFLWINPHKIAASITILLTFCYLALSGFSPSATRAFLMTTIGLISIMLGKGVLSMRNIAFVAFVILLFDSGSLFSVSFQLSFSAVTVLIAFYETYQNRINKIQYKYNGFIQKLLIHILTSIVTTLIANIATAPISIATFNRLSICGIFGNIIAIPFVCFCIIPLGLLCLIGGYHFDSLINILEFCIQKLIDSLTWISNLPYSDITIKSPHTITLYTIIFGGIVLCIFQTKLRYIGSFISSIGLYSWIFEQNPTVIILPESNVICFIDDGKFYTTTRRKSRNLATSIQRNYGFVETIERKIEYSTNKYSFCNLKLPGGIFLWSNGKICTLTKSVHPYCPVRYSSL